MEILTSQQMRAIDRRAIGAFGLPEVVLMENAGLQLLTYLCGAYPDLAVRRLLLLCGPGNNGGDTFVLARHLRNRGHRFEALLFGRRREVRGSAAMNLKALEKLGVSPREVRTPADWRRALAALAECDLVIDGILGTGLSRPVQGLLARVFADVNQAEAEVVAVDVPSGLSGDTGEIPGPCIAADATVTFARPKMPHVFPPAEALCGDLHVADISIPPQAVAAERIDLLLQQESDLVPLLPVRRADSHKGDYGHALVVAGSRGKGGAARMVALGALRAGCGLVTAAVPASLQNGMVLRAMEVMTEGLPEGPEGALSARALPRLLAQLPGKRVVAIGPGLTSHPETKKLIRDLVAHARVPVVLDADGINAFAGDSAALSGRRRPIVLTPHPGEMGRLLGVPTDRIQSRRIDMARSFARRHGCVLVLKGHRTLIAAPSGRVHVNPTGNPGMATGGSGDVLTGILAGLIAQGLGVEEAARLGTYLHGLAGDLAAGEVGEMPLMARDILEQFPKALARLRPPRDLDLPSSRHGGRSA
ncbi:MAG: bifunctional ADP-dependent NAD(P)H-hydrate dehydratase/NAD(P)H-hydrate epimerase [Acidobacteria bacterium]|nr:MAG: bifunctional ADP-dependent NAD(P)H-hydrate dehydratase/NAD(P)H-hydrate epimerase [Acidobacteriota bacterium]